MKRGNIKYATLVPVLLVLVLLIYAFLIAPYQGGGSAEQQETVTATTASSEPAEVDKASQYLILVNKNHSIDDSYIPHDLVTLKNRAPGRAMQYQRLRKMPAEAFERLVIEAQEAGHTIKVTTAFRPYQYQKQLYEQYLAKNALDARDYSAPPGYSEHETGLAVDISIAALDYKLEKEFGETKEGKWIANNSYKYGFILRYQKGKEGITGYQYEPWHLRYVGREAAKELYEQEITLEEYLEEF